MRQIDIATATDDEFAAWQAEYVAAIEDGSLRAEITAENIASGKTTPEWEAEFGDKAWQAAMKVLG